MALATASTTRRRHSYSARAATTAGRVSLTLGVRFPYLANPFTTRPVPPMPQVLTNHRVADRSSYYKRSPRQNFMQRTYKRLKRLLRDLVHYAKSHPWKVFSLVLMPLLTTGILGSLLARFGLRIPPSLERLLGAASRAAATGDSLGLVTDAVRMAGDLRRSPGPESGGRVRTQTQTRWETKPAGYGSYGSYDSYDTYRGSYRGEVPYTRGQSARSTNRGGGGGYGGLDEGWGSTVVDMARKFF